MRTMRLETLRPPPNGRYWNQKVLEPPSRMRTPKPVTWLSQRNTWPVLGARARETAVSVSFSAIAASSLRQHRDSTGRDWPCLARYGAVWRDMSINQGKSGTCPVFCLAWYGGGRGRGCPGVGRRRPAGVDLARHHHGECGREATGRDELGVDLVKLREGEGIRMGG